MSSNLPVTYGAHLGRPAPRSKPERYDVPLGTAAWYRFPDGSKPVYKAGELLVGYPLDGGVLSIGDDSHALLVSKTRGGKGVSVIVPNLIYWPGSAMVIDPKGENAIVTARRRGNGSSFTKGKGQTVRILDPFNEVKTEWDDFADLKCRYNPLDYLKTSEHPVDDVAILANALVTSEQSGDRFWPDSARGLIAYLALHIVSDTGIEDDQRSLWLLRDYVVAGDESLHSLMQGALEPEDDIPSALQCLFLAMQRNHAFGGVVARAGRMYAEMYENAPKTLQSIFAVAQSETRFLDSPAMRKTVSTSDFTLSELKESAKGTSLFLCLPHRYTEEHHRWLRLMTALTIAELERQAFMPRSGHPVLMILDEFPSLGYMKIIEDSAAQLAGHGVRMMFVTQSLPALKKVYGDNFETFVANSGTKLFLGVEDNFTREYVSKLIGECEVTRATVNSSQNRSQQSSSTIGTTVSNSVSRTNGWSSSNSFGGGSVFGTGATYGSSSSSSTTRTLSQSFNRSHTSGVTSGSSSGRNEVVHKRPLVTPDEVGRLFGNKDNPLVLVLVSGEQPIAVERMQYFSSKSERGRFDPHPKHPVPPTLAELSVIEVEERQAAERAKIELQEQQHKEANRRKQQKIESELQRKQEAKARRWKDLLDFASWLGEKICGFSILGIILGLFGVACWVACWIAWKLIVDWLFV